MSPMNFNVRENVISSEIIRCAIEAHRSLGGPGLLESVYEAALEWELKHAGLQVARQVTLPVHYKGDNLGEPLRLDMLVEGCVIVECKATEEMHPIFRAQAMTYLHLTQLRLALIINFGMPVIKKGIWRVANGLPDEPSSRNMISMSNSNEVEEAPRWE